MAQHLSIRIPWKDNGYDGRVCDKPCYNTSCLKLKSISENKDDELESGIAYYWEHCGMLGDYGYSKHWEEKKKIYEKHGIVEGKNFIVTRDTLNGAIDSQEIKKVIEKLKAEMYIE